MHRLDEQPQGVRAGHHHTRERDRRDRQLGFEGAEQDQKLADEVGRARHRERGQRDDQEQRCEHRRAEGDPAHLAHVFRAAAALRE